MSNLNITIKHPPLIEASILLYPINIEGKFYKGLLLVRKPANIVKNYPDIKQYFLIMSTTRWREFNRTAIEDIHCLAATFEEEKYRKLFPHGKCVVLNGADFCNKKTFHPLSLSKKYDIIFISRVAPFKRHELLIKVLYLLKNHYGKNPKVLAVTMFSKELTKISSLFVIPSTLAGLKERIKFFLYSAITKLRYKKAVKTGLNIEHVTNRMSHKDLCISINESKIYLLLSKSEGGNRAAKQALYCDVPILLIKGSQPADSNISKLTGQAVEDDPKAIAEAIIYMIDGGYKQYSPRQGALKLDLNRKIELWKVINSVQRFPGYPDIDRANEIRKKHTGNKVDNYLDLNHRGENMVLSLFKDELAKIREKFKSNC